MSIAHLLSLGTILQHADNFDDFWRVASKVTPTTAPTRSQSPPPSSASVHGRPPSADPGNVPDRDGAYSVRCIPVRVYLPDGPVLQDLVPPMLEDGKTPINYDPNFDQPSMS